MGTGVTTRQAEPCTTLEATYQSCLKNLSSTGAKTCASCVHDKWPLGGDDDDKVLCTDFHDFACTGPTGCASCDHCQDETSDWIICLHDNGGCTPQDCPTSPGGGGGEGSTEGESCPGGSFDACLSDTCQCDTCQ